MELVVSATPGEPFDGSAFGTVGVYDVDWLVEPGFGRLLDNLAASPGAFRGVRFFGALTAGERESFQPESGGSVWSDPTAPMDFSVTFRALEALISRGLTPFVVLGLFPAAVSSSPIVPPDSWGRWQQLVRGFLTQLAADPRFGPEAVQSWWFEAWNEPNEGRFWQGTQEQYLALHRATSEAVRATGLSIRLGGPAIAYKPEVDPSSGRPWMDRFLRFVAADPDLRCDFISLHRKGTVTTDEPDPRRLFDAAAEVADLALAIDPDRFAGITIVNNEADEKVGFEVPYAPRLDHRNAAWLGATTVLSDILSSRYQSSGIRFVAAADNANLQLVQAPFDGRRSIMTFARPGIASDLLKLSAYNAYEILRLLGDRHGSVVSGGDACFPTSDLYHLLTVTDAQIAAILASYPTPGEPAVAQPIDYDVRDIPWHLVNIATFQIDGHHSNAYAAAGGGVDNPFPVPEAGDLPRIRLAQELALVEPIRRNVTIRDGTLRQSFTVEPYSTRCFWITPNLPDPPAAPSWIETVREGGNVILRWEPNREPFFYSYEVYLIQDDAPGLRLSPEPLRSALWVDTAPPAGERSYGVRAVSASGVASDLIRSNPIVVP